LASRVEIDEIDAKIIRALQRDARTSFADIAATCGVSTDTISKRFKRMKRNGVIIRTTLILNPKSLGYEHTACIGIRAEFSKVKEVINHTSRMPELTFCHPSLGIYNVFCMVVANNLESIARLKDHIKEQHGVSNVTMSIWIDSPNLNSFQNIELKPEGRK